MDSEGFSQAGLNTSRIMKRKPARTHTLSGLSLIASDWLDVDVDEPVDPDGLGGEGTDTASTGRVLAAPRTPTKAEREEHDVTYVPYCPWCRFCVMGGGLERRHLTQSDDRGDDRPRVLSDNGYLSGDSTTIAGCKGQTHWYDVRCSRFDEGRW